ncbi:MAG: hypothetical protein KKC30_15770 [Proteobacteria bacterium]|nr:hypothetical protein [Pseudomonadota bacterium]MBU4381591.1 hypothetical protein [Pseudomonadota bacterium]MCG2766577.1 hypothetical protein [Desulfarculaceae bacterium]
MKRELLGFEKQGDKWCHNPQLTEAEAWLVDTIATYNQRPGKPLAPMEWVADFTALDARSVRELINHLIRREYHGLPIYPLPGGGGGYFVGSPDNVHLARRAVRTHLKRVITGGLKARALGASAAELGQSMVQLTLDLPGGEAREVAEEMSGLLAEAGLPVSQAAVATTLARYQKDPQRYAQEIKELAEQYGGMFLRREDLRVLLEKMAREMVERSLAELEGKAA